MAVKYNAVVLEKVFFSGNINGTLCPAIIVLTKMKTRGYSVRCNKIRSSHCKIMKLHCVIFLNYYYFLIVLATCLQLNCIIDITGKIKEREPADFETAASHVGKSIVNS